MPNSINSISGKAIPLKGNDIDTDRIIPARFLKCITFDGLGEFAFEDDRIQEKEKGGIHPFDESKYQESSVLLVNKNFGCGSSREHAPQALQRFGIQGIIGESFAEIFHGNCVSLGIPCLLLDEEEICKLQAWVEENPNGEVSLSVKDLSIKYGDKEIKARLSSSVQEQFLSGNWNILGILTANLPKVKEQAEKIPYLQWKVS